MTEIIGGRYQIIKHLGGGGFGQTFLAEDTHLPDNLRCVVKLLMPLTVEGSQLVPLPKDSPHFQVAQRLFNTEAKVLYKLGEHDQIPKLLAHFEDDREFYLVQEYVEGEVLATEIIAGQRWNEAQAIDFLLDILTPLAFVHQHKIIHRDLKPANLIRRKRDGKIVLIDFGAVKEFISETLHLSQNSPNQSLSSRTISIGTPGYSPGEQAIGKPQLCSDVYAVGIIAIQALTGMTPDQFSEDPNTKEIIWRDRAQVSSKLAEVIDKMIRYDFRQRYQSAEEAFKAIKNLDNKQKITIPISTNKPTSFVKPSLINSRKIKIFLSLILATVIGAIIVSHTINIRLPKNETPSKKEEPIF
jgi:serine/threonine protein kinase